MYYDRTICEALAKSLNEGGPLAWLSDFVQSPKGRAHHAHLQLRRAAGSRAQGSIQLYWGRTSPFEVQGRSRGMVRLNAHGTYRNLSPSLFNASMSLEALWGQREAIEAHLDRASALLHGKEARRNALIQGEAICHAGMTWRYSHNFQEGDPLLALDAEARIGFASRDAQRQADAALTEHLALNEDDAIPKKLDTIALSPTGDILLIEVKDEAGDIRRAVTQAAAHVARFRELLAGDLHQSLSRLLAQKRAIGLIPDLGPMLALVPQIIPWVAAPDRRADWAERWSAESADLRHKWRGLIGELRWVQLTEYGDVLEVRTP